VVAHREPARVRRLIALVALLTVGATYFGTWSLGLWWDDYVALRPWRIHDVASAFTGSWDRWDVWPAYYRPLSVAWYAVSFELFGLHALPMHLVSLAGLAAAAWLAGLFAWRETGTPIAGIAAAALYSTHPAVALAQGPWLFLQNHLLCTLLVLAALLSWQKRRAEPGLGRWWPLFALALAGFLVQEDMIVLAPSLLMLQYIRARTVADVPRPGTRLVLLTLVFIGCLAAGRWALLGQLGGPPFHSLTGMAANIIRGPVRTLLLLEDSPAGIQWLGSAGLIVTLIAGAWTAVRGARATESMLLVTGLGLVACFSVPLVFASSWSRFHLVALGAVLALAGSIHVCRRFLAVARGWPTTAWVIVLAMVLGVEAQSNVRHTSCSDPILWSDAQVLNDWPQVPAHVRAWLAAKPAACGRGEDPRLSSIDIAAWIVDDRSHTLAHASVDGGSGTRVVALIAQHATAFALDVRAAPGGGPVQIQITTNGTTAPAVTAGEEWQTVSVPMSPNWRTRLRAMHRVDLTVPGDHGGAQFEVRGLRAIR
jgi:hypothetical protein